MTGGVASSSEALPDQEPSVAADMWVTTRACAEVLKAGYSIIFPATLGQGREMSHNLSPLKEPHLLVG